MTMKVSAKIKFYSASLDISAVSVMIGDEVPPATKDWQRLLLGFKNPDNNDAIY